MLSRVSFFISPKCNRFPITRDIKIIEIISIDRPYIGLWLFIIIHVKYEHCEMQQYHRSLSFTVGDIQPTNDKWEACVSYDMKIKRTFN